MNKFDSTKLQTKFDNTSEGWLVQVYSGDRRLLCVLDCRIEEAQIGSPL